MAAETGAREGKTEDKSIIATFDQLTGQRIVKWYIVPHPEGSMGHMHGCSSPSLAVEPVGG